MKGAFGFIHFLLWSGGVIEILISGTSSQRLPCAASFSGLISPYLPLCWFFMPLIRHFYEDGNTTLQKQNREIRPSWALSLYFVSLFCLSIFVFFEREEHKIASPLQHRNCVTASTSSVVIPAVPPALSIRKVRTCPGLFSFPGLCKTGSEITARKPLISHN